MASEPVLDVYARVSRLGDKRQRSIVGQVKDCMARIADTGAQVGEVLDRDRGRSAWNAQVKRPDWDRLMERLESGASDGVVVFDLARFSRRPIEGERLIAAAERGLLVLDSEGEYDLTTPSGKKAFRDQMNSAAYESDRLSTRAKRGKRLKAMAGEPNNGRYRPFGWEPDGVTVRESEACVLREIARRLLQGQSQWEIVTDLNQRGVTTSTGGQWTTTSLRQVMTRSRNTGVVTYLGAPLSRLPEGSAILDEATGARINALYASRRRGRPPSGDYLCSGISRCGVCGGAMTGRTRSQLAPYPDGAVRRQYSCQPRANGGCGRVSVDQRELDQLVRALAIHWLADPRHAAAVEATIKVASERRQRIEAEIADLEQLAELLAGRLGRREITLARHDAAVGPIDSDLQRLRAELLEVDSTAVDDVAPELMAASRAEWEARWDAATVAERRTLLRRALRGRRLVVNPVDRRAPRRFDPKRVTIED